MTAAPPAAPTAGLDDARTDALLVAARAAMARAYAPYSRFRVGAALLCDDGTDAGLVVTGCNVENAGYAACLCAERVAVGAAVAQGLRRFRAVAIATEADVPSPPCGVCRQVLVEFAPALPVVSIARDGQVARWSLDTLLPHPFDPASLSRG